MTGPDRLRQPRSVDVTAWPQRAGARSMLRALGFDDDDFQRPQVGVAATWNRITPCNAHLDVLREPVIEALRSEGVAPMSFDTISVSDGIAMGHEGMRASLVSRDWIADTVELVVLAERFDGLYALAGCDKTLPGMMMAMIRLDLPSVFGYGGSLRPGVFKGRRVSLQDVYEGVGAHSCGLMSDDDLHTLERSALVGLGSCAGMFSANTMASVSEALGLTVPGMASAPADTVARSAVLCEAARVLVDALAAQRSPSSFLEARSFENAIAVAAALGGSTNACLHVPALAGEAGIEFGLNDISRVSRRTPQIAELKPSGRFMMDDLHDAGGVPAVMAELSGRRVAARRRDDGDRPHRRREHRSGDEGHR